jgi:hypothetical protein
VPADEDGLDVEPFRIPDAGRSVHVAGNVQQSRLLTIEELRIQAVIGGAVRLPTSDLPSTERVAERLKRRQSKTVAVQDEFTRNPPVWRAREPEEAGLCERLHDPMLAVASDSRHRSPGSLRPR